MKEGRIQRKLREMLEAKGYSDVKLYPATGAHRTDTRMDCYRWTASVRKQGVRANYLVCLQSWFTMTEVVRSGGMDIDDDGDVTPQAAMAV